MKNGKLIETGIRRVVWIPEKLDQEIENLRHKIGYTRSGFYRYALTRLMEQLLLSKRREIHLKPWEEIVGILKTIETDSQTITAVISCTQNLEIALPYPKGTSEATTIEKLSKHLGQKIAILHTDNPQKPLTIRTFCDTAVAHKVFCKNLWFRKRVFLVLRCAFFFKGCCL
jgi:hypothetical protein